ncbi:MAG: DUF481 domain-containing protein [Acidobacteriota bacterium]
MRNTNHFRPLNQCLMLLVLAVLGLSLPLSAREKTDVIVMKNGDKITCEIKSLQSNTLYISVDYILNTISVDWTKVEHVESKQLFLVKTQDGTVYKGLISTRKALGGRPVEIEVLETAEKKVAIERQQVVDVSQTSTKLWQRFNGEIGSGFTFTKGNESSQYNLSTEVNYVEERWTAGADYSSNLNSSTGSTTSTRNDLTLSGRRLLKWNHWYYTGLAGFLQSSAQGIRLQTTLGGGIGRNIKNTGSTSFTVYGGFAWQQINYNQAIIAAKTQHVTSALIGTSLQLFRFDRTTLKVNANLLPAVSEPGRLHFTMNSSYYVKLWGKLNWNFTFYDNWDNRPPPGFSGSDYGTTSGLSLSFGNR